MYPKAINDIIENVFGKEDCVTYQNLRNAMKNIGFDEIQIENTIIECRKYENSNQ